MALQPDSWEDFVSTFRISSCSPSRGLGHPLFRVARFLWVPPEPGQEQELRGIKTLPYLCSLSTSPLPEPGQGTKLAKGVDSVRSLSF